MTPIEWLPKSNVVPFAPPLQSVIIRGPALALSPMFILSRCIPRYFSSTGIPGSIGTFEASYRIHSSEIKLWCKQREHWVMVCVLNHKLNTANYFHKLNTANYFHKLNTAN